MAAVGMYDCRHCCFVGIRQFAMMRVPRKELNEAIKSLLIACARCTDTQGLKVVFTPEPEQAETALLAAMSMLAHPRGPVTPADVYFLTGFGTDQSTSWPPQVKKE